MKALVFQSNPSAQPTLASMMEDAGFQVHGVSDVEALMAALSECPDLVLCDGTTQNATDGHDVATVCRGITADRATAAIPVFVIVSRDRPSDLARALESGATDVIVSPFVASRLVERLTSRLASASPSRTDGYRADLLATFVATLEDFRVLHEEADAFRRRAVEASQHQEQLMDIVTHDLRTPLSTLRMGADLLTRTLSQDSKATAIVRSLDRAIDVMNQLLSDLPDLHALAGFDFKVHPTAHRADALIHEATEALKPIVNGKPFSLHAEPSPDDLSIHCDRDCFVQILTRWVTFRAKALRTEDAFSVGARRANDRVAISVVDTGPCIDEEQRQNLFIPYWLADRSARAQSSLSLSVARGLIEAHGGTLALQSTEGSTSFAFTLPTAHTTLGE